MFISKQIVARIFTESDLTIKLLNEKKLVMLIFNDATNPYDVTY